MLGVELPFGREFISIEEEEEEVGRRIWEFQGEKRKMVSGVRKRINSFLIKPTTRFEW